MSSISSNAALTIQSADVIASEARHGDWCFVQASEYFATLSDCGWRRPDCRWTEEVLFPVGIRFSFGGDTVTGTPGLTVNNNAS